MPNLNWSPEVAARLREYVKRVCTQDELAERAGVPKPTLSKVLRGVVEPKISTLLAITREAGVSIDELFLGSDAAALITPLAQHAVRGVPLHDVTMSAGEGLDAIEAGDSDARIEFPENWLRDTFGQLEGLRLVRVKGDSMEPALLDGSLLMIDVHRTEPSDGLFALRYYDQLLVKRVQFDGKSVRLSSDNARYKDTVIDLTNTADRDALHLIGRAVWSGNMM